MPSPELFTIFAPSPTSTEVLNVGSLFGADAWGTAAAILSLLTNLVATSLIGYRAWCVTVISFIDMKLAA